MTTARTRAAFDSVLEFMLLSGQISARLGNDDDSRGLAVRRQHGPG